MTKLDEELAALLAPLGASVEQPTAYLPIHVEFLGARASYDLTTIRLYCVDETHPVSSAWHGSTRLLEADKACDTMSGPTLEGVRIAPCTTEVERTLAKRRFPWCASPERNSVLAVLPSSEIVPLLRCVDHEYHLATRRRRYQQQRTAQVFSVRLRQVLWHREGTRLLRSISDEWPCGWLDGLCNLLAEGLLEWVCASGQQLVESLAPHLMILAGEGKAVDHVVLQIGTWFLDGDGVSSRRTLLRRWQNQEGLVRPRLIAYNSQVVERAGIPRNQERSCEIAAYLTQGLGTFSSSWLTGER